MSNNRLWKRKLQDKIDRHNHRHGRKPKGVSNKTMHERASSLFRAFVLLRRLGYQLDPNGLAGRHIQVLVDYWTCNARVAGLCRQHGVAMLEGAHSAAYIQQQLSFLRVYATAYALWRSATTSSARRSNGLCHSRRTPRRIWDTPALRSSNASSASTT